MERVFNYIKAMNRICNECSYGCTLEIENIIESKEEVKDNLDGLLQEIDKCRIKDGIGLSDYYFNIIESLMWKQHTIEEKRLVKEHLLERCISHFTETPEVLDKLEMIIEHIGIGNDLWIEYGLIIQNIKDYKTFISRVERLVKEKENNPNELCNPICTLHWCGQKNVLTDMFRQAKNKDYITNSLPEIAQFLKDGFDCFANTKLSTIEGMLKNNSSSANAIPKEEKRIQIE